jgi:hypothetical protein
MRLRPAWNGPRKAGGAADGGDIGRRSAVAQRRCPAAKAFRETAGWIQRTARIWSMIPKSGYRFSEKIMLHE